MIAFVLIGSPLLAEGVLRRHFTMKKLMPCGMIVAIEPSERYVWFGGWELRPGEEHGLARYDKRTGKWELFLESEGVIAGEVNALAVDGEQLWIGSSSDWRWNRGLHLYSPKTHTNRLFREQDGLPYRRVHGIAVLDDAVWVATMGGVGRYDKKTQTWKAFTKKAGHLANDFTTCISADERYIWAGSYSGLEMYDRQRGLWRSLNKDNGPFQSAVIDIDSDEETVWFLSQQKVLIFDRATRQFSRWPIVHEPAKKSELRNIEVTADKVFLGSDKGLHVWDKKTDSWKTYTSRNGLRHDYVYTLGADDDYVWCVDRLGRAVSRLDRKSRRWDYFHYRERSPSNHINALVSDGSNLYVGTLGDGLWKYEIKRNRWRNLNLLLKSGPRTFSYHGEKTPVKFSHIRQMVLHDGRAWMATNHGLCVHDPATKEDIEVLSRGSVPMLCLARFKSKWLCGGQRTGLTTFDPETGTWDEIGKRIGLAKKVAAIQAGAEIVWVTDGKKVYRLAPDAEELSQIEGTPEGRIRALLLHEGKLWIGADRGLWVYDTENKSIREIDKAKLPSPVVLTLSYARGRICIGTEGGLASCTPSETDWRIWTKDDLLVHNIVSAVAGDSRYLWVGTMGAGFTRLTGVNAPRPEPEEGAE